MRIDLNADVGESLGPWPMGDDERLIPLVSSVNVACGAHAGDPLTIERTIQLAMVHDVAIGAHPGYPDLIGFGRRDLEMTRAELLASIVYQVGAVAAVTRSLGAELRHVKPHGALYNRAARDPAIAETIAVAIRRSSPELVLVGLAGSALLDAGVAEGLQVASEAFADRAYDADGSLRSRRLDGAILGTPEAAARQAVGIVRDGRVTTHNGKSISVHADTICIHGDTPGAADYATAIRTALADVGVKIAALAR